MCLNGFIGNGVSYKIFPRYLDPFFIFGCQKLVVSARLVSARWIVEAWSHHRSLAGAADGHIVDHINQDWRDYKIVEYNGICICISPG